MPLENERSSRLAHVPLAKAPHVAAAISRWQTAAPRVRYAPEVAALTRAVEDLAAEHGALAVPAAGLAGGVVPPMRFCLAIDGSLSEVTLADGSMVGFVVTAAALTDVERFRQARVGRFVDTRALASATTRFAVEAAVPSALKASLGLSGVETWRIAVNDMLGLAVDGHAHPYTLASALRLLYGSTSAAVPIRACPSCGHLPGRGEPGLASTVDTGPDGCTACGGVLYLGDALHTHPEFNEEGENGNAMSRLMNVSERLMMVGHIEATSAIDPGLLDETLLVTDGPLAIFGTRSGNLVPRFASYLAGVNTDRLAEGRPMLMHVGIEKTGSFAEHARLITDMIEPGHVMMPTADYIRRHIVRRVEDHNVYGAHEFYGRRFFYRMRSGGMLVLTVPPVPGVAAYSRERASEAWASYPTLPVVITHLESMTSRLYANGVVPLMTAHAGASLPQGTGTSVLAALAAAAGQAGEQASQTPHT